MKILYDFKLADQISTYFSILHSELKNNKEQNKKIKKTRERSVRYFVLSTDNEKDHEQKKTTMAFSYYILSILTALNSSSSIAKSLEMI